MNLVDLLLILVFLFGVFAGFRKGFILGSVDLLSLVLSLLAAFRAYRYVAGFFEKNIDTIGVWSLPLAFIACYIIARVILSAIAAPLLRGIPARGHNNGANKAGGVIPGAVNGVINAAVLAALLLALPLFDGLSAQTRDSALANRLLPHVEWAEEKFAPVFDRAVHHSINKLTVNTESDKSIELPFSVKEPKIREDLEARMLVLVNEERAKEGLPALKPDPEAREVARAHSRDMFARSYFSHVNPDGKSPADRARKAGLRYLAFGENLALAQTLSIAHTGLMNSPGHRANILHKAYGRVGIGVLEGGRHGLMITQNFRN